MKNPQNYLWIGPIEFLMGQTNSFMLIKYKNLGPDLMHFRVSWKLFTKIFNLQIETKLKPHTDLSFYYWFLSSKSWT